MTLIVPNFTNTTSTKGRNFYRLASDRAAMRARFRRIALASMPRDGTMILSDVRGSTLTIICESCGRGGRYRVERPMAPRLVGNEGRGNRAAINPP
jgi:hypothetical protein